MSMCLCLTAADTVLPELQVGQRIFKNIAILGVDATDLYFKYEGGIRNVKLRDLQPDLQKMFGYDPARAAEIEQRRLAEDRQFAETVTRILQTEAMARTRGPETLGEDSLADPIAENTPLNKPMPELTVDKWLTEKPTLTGKLVIVYFLKPTSAPCKPYINQFNAWQKKYSTELVVVGISPEEEPSEPNAPKIEFALGIDRENRLAKAVGFSHVPQILFIDTKGIVRYCGHPAAVTEKTLRKMAELFGVPFEEQEPAQTTIASPQST